MSQLPDYVDYNKPEATKILLAVTIIFIGFYSYVSHSENRNEFTWPSPPRLPLLGSLLWVVGRNLVTKCLTWREKYGPIFALKLGTRDEFLMVTGAKLALELLLTNGSKLETRDCPLFYAKELRLSEYFTPAMSTSPQVIAQRKLVYNTIHMVLAEGRGNSIDRAATQFLKEVHQRCMNFPGEPMATRQILLDCSVVCALNLGFGLRWSHEEVNRRKEAREIVEATQGIFEMLNYVHEPSLAFEGLVPLLWWRSEKLRSKAKKLSERLLGSHVKLYTLAQHLVEERGGDAVEASVAKSLLVTDKNADMSDFQKHCLAGTTMAASSTSTANLIHSVMGCLAAFPKWQDKVQEEVDSYVVKICDEANEIRLPGPEAGILLGLPILGAVVHETLRLFPIFPLLDRTASDDIHLSTGGVIKKGKRIFFLYHNINRDPIMYHEPEEFQPDRFLETTVQRFQDDSKNFMWPKYRHSSFGGGRRACPGSEFAIHEAMCFLARLIYAFDFSFPSGVTGPEQLGTSQPGIESHVCYPDLIFKPRRSLPEFL